jgi:hypothetical protein
MISVKNCNSQDELLKFLNELDKKYNLAQIIVSVIKDGFGRYEVYYKDYTKETEADRLL